MTYCDRRTFHLVVSLVIAACVGAIFGAVVLGPSEIPAISKWGLASAVGYLSVYVAEKVLKCGPSNT